VVLKKLLEGDKFEVAWISSVICWNKILKGSRAELKAGPCWGRNQNYSAWSEVPVLNMTPRLLLVVRECTRCSTVGRLLSASQNCTF